MRIALAMICKGSDEEAKLLDRCLGNMSPHVDGIFITRTTLPGETPNAKVASIAKKHKAILSDFEWCYDFAKARNFNFSQVPPEFDYILWSDADDMWRGLDKLKPTLESSPGIDAIGVEYSYDWDEHRKPTVVHRKTMCIKNDGCAMWVGAIHEDLDPLRSMEVFFVKGIERLHLSNGKRHEANALRNLDISKRQADALPDDPRSYFNLANSYIGVADWQAAAKAFEHFLTVTESDEERYLAHERLATVYKGMGNVEAASKELRLAIGLAPELPEAYFQLGHVYYESGDMDKAEYYLIQGLLRKPKLDRMIVYNPRDYDYNPMMLLARVYFQKNRPDLMLPLLEGCAKIYPDDESLKTLVKEGREEKEQLGKALEAFERLEKITDLDELKREMDALPEDVRSHPQICALRNKHFVKEESSGRDLIIYCSHTTHEWNPELFKKKGVGGSEEAVVHLAREWAKLGWNVTVYNNCGHKMMEADSVTYRPFWEFNYRDKQDVVILWRWPKALDAPINASKIFVDLHDVVPAGEFNQKRLEKVTKIFVKTQFHRSLFPNVPDSKIAVIPNGMVAPEYLEKDENLIINTSSPDRSMDVMPRLFEEIKKQVPTAKMQWAYGFDIFKQSYSSDVPKMLWASGIEANMKRSGIENLGRLPQAEVSKLYSKAKVFAYPTEFAEIDCISVKKAQAGGAIAVTTDFAALKESNQLGVTIHSEKTKDTWAKPYQFHFGLEDEKAQKQFVKAVVKALKAKSPSKKQCEEFAKRFEWSRIAKEWDAIFEA